LWSFAAIQTRQPHFLPTLASSHCTCMCLAPATSEYGVRASYDGLFGFLERRNEVNLAVGVARQYGLSRSSGERKLLSFISEYKNHAPLTIPRCGPGTALEGSSQVGSFTSLTREWARRNKSAGSTRLLDGNPLPSALSWLGAGVRC
jgi:hypothetical protein